MSNGSYKPKFQETATPPQPASSPVPASFGGGGGGTPVTAAPPANARFANLKPGTAKFAATIKLPD